MTTLKTVTDKYEHKAICIGNVHFETTGYCGGDAGHGGRLLIKIEDEANLIFDAKVIRQMYSPHSKSVELVFHGDGEMEAAYAIIRFLADRLAPILERK